MGKTLKEWKEYIEDMKTKQLQDVVSSCESLMSFTELKKEFQWTGLGIIGSIARSELRNRRV